MHNWCSHSLPNKPCTVLLYTLVGCPTVIATVSLVTREILNLHDKFLVTYGGITSDMAINITASNHEVTVPVRHDTCSAKHPQSHLRSYASIYRSNDSSSNSSSYSLACSYGNFKLLESRLLFSEERCALCVSQRPCEALIRTLRAVSGSGSNKSRQYNPEAENTD